MIDTIEALKNNPSGVLATHNGDKLDTRVFRSLFGEDNKLYLYTRSGGV